MRHLGRVTAAAGWALFALWAWAPLAAWVAAPFRVDGVASIVLPSGRRAGLLLETLAYAAGVAVIASVAGAAAALHCWRRDTPLARLAERTALLAAPIPPYLHALAWMPMFAALPGRGAGGWQGWLAAGWVQCLAMLPFCFGLARLALEGVDPRWIDSARVYGEDRLLMSRVLFPALRPAFAAAYSLAFLLTLTDPAVPSLFSQSAYSMEVLAEYSATHDAARAMLLATPLMLAGLAALVPLGWFWRAMSQRPAPAAARLAPLAIAGPQRLTLSCGAGLVVLPALALAAALARQSWPLSAWTGSISAGLRDAGVSASAALVAGVLACLSGLVISRLAARRPVLTWWLLGAPLAAPGALMGAGLIWIWNRDLPVTPYGTVWMLVLAALSRFAPIGVFVVAAWRNRMDPLLLDAARVFGPPGRAFLRVELPLLAPGAAACVAIVFALSMSELGATLLVVPPGANTLAIRIYNYLHYGASGSVAALALLLMSGVAVAVLAAARLWRTRL